VSSGGLKLLALGKTEKRKEVPSPGGGDFIGGGEVGEPAYRDPREAFGTGLRANLGYLGVTTGF
jgi:hypothetical protein